MMVFLLAFSLYISKISNSITPNYSPPPTTQKKKKKNSYIDFGYLKFDKHLKTNKFYGHYIIVDFMVQLNHKYYCHRKQLQLIYM